MNIGIAPKRIVFYSLTPWCCDFSPAPSSPIQSFPFPPLLLPVPFFLVAAAALLEAKASLTGACFSLGRANNEGICGWQAACQWLKRGERLTALQPPAASHPFCPSVSPRPLPSSPDGGGKWAWIIPSVIILVRKGYFVNFNVCS